MLPAARRALLLLFAAASLASLASVSGCGQTGALYFDEDPPADQLPPSKKNGTAPVTP